MATIWGTQSSETLIGTTLSDTINGLGGDDWLYGGLGNDTLNGGAGTDRLFGGEGNDKLNGGYGRDYLYGGNGNDTLNGGRGQDFLTGGAGADKFVVDEKADSGVGAGNRDVITDFKWWEGDKIDVSGIDAKSNWYHFGNQSFSWIGQQGFTGSSGQLHQKFENGNTIIEGDTNGDKVADFQIELTGTHYLIGSDFVL